MNIMKLDILKQALEGRIQEVTLYQINIDNYRRAIAHIDCLPFDKQSRLQDFRADLANRLEAEETEQMKAQVMLKVIGDQVKEMDGVRPD